MLRLENIPIGAILRLNCDVNWMMCTPDATYPTERVDYPKGTLFRREPDAHDSQHGRFMPLSGGRLIAQLGGNGAAVHYFDLFEQDNSAQIGEEWFDLGATNVEVSYPDTITPAFTWETTATQPFYNNPPRTPRRRPRRNLWTQGYDWNRGT